MVRLTAVAMLFTAAALAADSPVGHYVLRGVMEVGSELLLRPDGTFEYALEYGAADYEASGTWKVDGDAVVLTTSGEDKQAFRLIRSAAVKGDGIRVIVKGPGGDPADHIEVGVKTGEGYLNATTDDNGVASFTTKSAASSIAFRIPVYSYAAGPFPLNPQHNEFQFEIDGAAITRVPFKAERLKINGKTLEMRFWDRDKVMNYEKQ